MRAGILSAGPDGTKNDEYWVQVPMGLFLSFSTTRTFQIHHGGPTLNFVFETTLPVFNFHQAEPRSF